MKGNVMSEVVPFLRHRHTAVDLLAIVIQPGWRSKGQFMQSSILSQASQGCNFVSHGDLTADGESHLSALFLSTLPLCVRSREASLVTQTVNSLSVMLETQVRSLGGVGVLC